MKFKSMKSNMNYEVRLIQVLASDKNKGLLKFRRRFKNINSANEYKKQLENDIQPIKAFSNQYVEIVNLEEKSIYAFN